VCWFTLSPSFEQLHWQVIIAMPTPTFGCYGCRAQKCTLFCGEFFAIFPRKKGPSIWSRDFIFLIQKKTQIFMKKAMMKSLIFLDKFLTLFLNFFHIDK
jgi:hypothetical protein